jgi:hypothetical protein
LTINDIILDKPVSIPRLVKESLASSIVNGKNIDNPMMLKSRTSRIKKAPVTKRECQLPHGQSGKFISSPNKES